MIRFPSTNIPFWGVIFIIIGCIIILNGVLPFKIPVGRIFWGSLIIFIGISIVFKPSSHISFTNISKTINSVEDLEKGEFSIAFGQATYTFDNSILTDTKNNIKGSASFGQMIFDLSSIDGSKELIVRADAAFSEFVIYIPKNQKIELIASSAFGAVIVDGNSVVSGFGNYKTKLGESSTDIPNLKIEVSSTFGSVRIESK